MDDNIAYGLNTEDIDDVLRLVDAKRRPPGGFRFPTSDGGRLIIAVATTGVPARSSITLGNATVAVKYLKEVSGNREVTDAGYTVKAHNLASTAVTTGAYIMCQRIGDVWVVVWEECA